jgi:hypothetical protein
VVLALDAADRDSVAAALGLSTFEAEQRVRRAGFQLHRIAEPAAAAAEAARLRDGGLTVLVVPEAEARSAGEPYLAVSGQWERGGLDLRLEDGARERVQPEDLLLVVRGPITRAHEPSERIRRVRLTAPEEGHRIHLHRRGRERPLELDPDAFEFGPGTQAASSLVRLLAWVDELARSAVVDEGFARLAPALGLAAPPAGTAATAARALRTGAASRRTAPALFDTVGQFRFYSGWRAAVERRRRS